MGNLFVNNTVTAADIKPGSTVSGPTLPERIEVLAVVPMGAALKVIGRGVTSGLTYDPVLSAAQLAQLTVSAEQIAFDGDARLFRLVSKPIASAWPTNTTRSFRSPSPASIPCRTNSKRFMDIF